MSNCGKFRPVPPAVVEPLPGRRIGMRLMAMADQSRTP